MDWLFLIILVLAIIIYFLDLMHKRQEQNKENFVSFPNNGVNYGGTTGKVAGYIGTTNFRKSKPDFQNFGIFGETPPIPGCNITVLGEKCTNYPYDTSQDNYQSVCQKSIRVFPYGQNNLKHKLNVMGRAIGRTRQCRNLHTP